MSPETTKSSCSSKNIKPSEYYENLIAENEALTQRPEILNSFFNTETLDSEASSEIHQSVADVIKVRVPFALRGSICIDSFQACSQCSLLSTTESLLIGEEDIETASEISEDSPQDHEFVPDIEIDSTASEDENNSKRIVSEEDFEYFIVSKSFLLSLLHGRRCATCGEVIISQNLMTVGVTIKITCHCRNGHIEMLCSSSVIKRRYDLNVSLICAASLCGIGYSSLVALFSTLKIPFTSHNTFYRITRTFLHPAVVKHYEERMVQVIEFFKDHDSIKVSGDGQFDSPGFSAKFCRYCLLEVSTGKILSFSVVQKGQFTTELVKVGCREALKSLLPKLPNVKDLVTDRHSGIKAMMPTEFPGIELNHDIWHMARNIKKAITKAAKKAAYKELGFWCKHIINHFWWSASHCEGSPEKLLQLFQSVLFHVVNVHKWGKNCRAAWFLEFKSQDGEGASYPKPFTLVTKCQHGPLKKRTSREIQWLEKGGVAHRKLWEIVTQPMLCEDMKKCTSFIHTGQNEVLHSVVLKYLPKRIHFPIKTQIIRMMIVSLEVDENSGYNLRKPNHCVSYSRAAGEYVLKTKYSEKSYNYRHDIMATIRTAMGKSIPKLDWRPYIKTPVPKNIVKKDKIKPKLSELLEKFEKYRRLK